MIAKVLGNVVFATKFTYASMGVIYGNSMMSLQLGEAEQNIWAFYEDSLRPIFNIIIIVLAAYGAFKVIMKIVQADEGAGKLIIIILGGLLMWFAIIPPVINAAKNGSLF